MQRRVAPDRLIEVDDILGRGELGQNHRLLRHVIGPLRVKHGEERIDAGPVASFGQYISVGGRRLLPRPRADLVIDGAAPGERVGHFAERGLDRLLVGRDGRIAIGFAQADVGVARAGLEDGVGRVRPGAPSERAAGEQLGKRAAGKAEQAGQADARKELSPRDAGQRQQPRVSFPMAVYLWEDEMLEVLPCIPDAKYPPVKAIEFHTSITSKFYGDDYAVK